MGINNKIFDGVEQKKILIDGHECTLPLFYTGGTATIGMFPAKLAELRSKSPSKDIIPARVLPGMGIVTIIAFEFETTIGPVNEVCVGVPIQQNGIIPSSLTMLKDLLQGRMPVWVWHLPVSTEIADIFGRTTWGFPKIHADIPIDQEENKHHCHLSYQGTPILTLSGCVPEGRQEIDINLKNHLWQNDHLQTARQHFHMNNVGFSLKPGALNLQLHSSHRIAQDLDDVLLSKQSLLAIRAPSLQAVLYEPDFKA